MESHKIYDFGGHSGGLCFPHFLETQPGTSAFMLLYVNGIKFEFSPAIITTSATLFDEEMGRERVYTRDIVE